MAKNQKMTDKSAKDILDLMGEDMRNFFVNMPKVEEKPSKFVVDKKGRLVLKKKRWWRYQENGWRRRSLPRHGLCYSWRKL